ncbi:MAG: hypothetical protein GXZ11_06010 [Tissierellia bacterium]|nr:hypothetical protein [Tissierellia bacterium]
MKKEHLLKMIAPIVVAIIFIVIEISYFTIFFLLLPKPWRYILAMIPIVFIIAMLLTLHQRIMEIRNGEEDDLSKY